MMEFYLKMKIKLLCPDCGTILTDVYSAEFCNIYINGSVFLDMECVGCNKDIRLKLQTTIINDEKTENTCKFCSHLAFCVCE